MLSITSCNSASTKPGIVTGTVSWRDPIGGSIPVKATLIKIWDDNSQQIGSDITHEDGRFSIPDIPVGLYTVTAYIPESVNGTQDNEKIWLISNVEVKSEKVTDLRFSYHNAYGNQLPEQYLK